jgi:hypothetical protein
MKRSRLEKITNIMSILLARGNNKESINNIYREEIALLRESIKNNL